jgi:hypothetical protein
MLVGNFENVVASECREFPLCALLILPLLKLYILELSMSSWWFSDN